MHKHSLLGMSVRHLTGSAELVTFLNRFGHCTSYSVLLELETAMCSSIEQQQSAIPPLVVPDKNSFIHLCLNTFDLTEETPSGAGTTHTAHGPLLFDIFINDLFLAMGNNDLCNFADDNTLYKYCDCLSQAKRDIEA